MANPMKAIKAVTRVVGGITGKGSKSVNPTYKATQTIKLKNTSAPGVLEERVKNYTIPSAIRQMKETGVASKTEAKANKRGLKAANKIKSGSKNVLNDKEKKNYKYWDEAYNQFADHTGKERGSFGISTENALKLSKPARPNRVRGGSMGSKVNWPKGMK